MLMIHKGHVFSGEHGIRIFRPRPSEISRPRAHCVLAICREAKVDVVLIKGEAQFDELTMCMAVFAESMAKWPDEGIAEAEHVEFGHARIALSAEKETGAQMHALTLQIFRTPADRLEPLEKPYEDIASEWSMSMTVAEVRTFGGIFAQVNGIQFVPAIMAANDEWSCLLSLAGIRFPNDGRRVRFEKNE